MSDYQVVKTFPFMRLTRITQTHAEPAWERSVCWYMRMLLKRRSANCKCHA